MISFLIGLPWLFTVKMRAPLSNYLHYFTFFYNTSKYISHYIHIYIHYIYRCWYLSTRVGVFVSWYIPSSRNCVCKLIGAQYTLFEWSRVFFFFTIEVGWMEKWVQGVVVIFFLKESQFCEIDGHCIEVDLQDYYFFSIEFWVHFGTGFPGNHLRNSFSWGKEKVRWISFFAPIIIFSIWLANKSFSWSAH